MKRVIRRIVTVITTEIWSVVDDEGEGGEDGPHLAQVYTAERAMISEYQVALDKPRGVVEINISNGDNRQKEVKKQ